MTPESLVEVAAVERPFGTAPGAFMVNKNDRSLYCVIAADYNSKNQLRS